MVQDHLHNDTYNLRKEFHNFLYIEGNYTSGLRNVKHIRTLGKMLH